MPVEGTPEWRSVVWCERGLLQGLLQLAHSNLVITNEIARRLTLGDSGDVAKFRVAEEASDDVRYVASDFLAGPVACGSDLARSLIVHGEAAGVPG